ncbi:MAG: phosphatase PAP2 family protein [Chloroflexota bacterium]
MRMASPPPTPDQDPTVAQASPAAWYAWIVTLARFGRRQIAALGLTLGIGLAVALLSLYLFAAIAEDVMEQETRQLDNTVLSALRQVQSPALDQVAWFVSALGSEILAVIMVLIVVLLVWQRRFGAALGLVVTVVGAQLLNNVLKDWFHRTRPAPVEGLIPAQAFSFPSGHAMVATAFYLFLGYLAWRLLAGRARAVCTAILVLVAVLIGLSRLYLGVHYLTDVVAGYVAGIAWTETVIVAGHLLARRRSRSDGTRPAGPPAATQPTDGTGLRDPVRVFPDAKRPDSA